MTDHRVTLILLECAIEARDSEVGTATVRRSFARMQAGRKTKDWTTDDAAAVRR